MTEEQNEQQQPEAQATHMAIPRNAHIWLLGYLSEQPYKQVAGAIRSLEQSVPLNIAIDGPPKGDTPPKAEKPSQRKETRSGRK